MNKSAAGAKKYYSEDYYKEGKNSNLDYYSEKDQIIGVWGGKGAGKLGLNGAILKEDFFDLCDNKVPGTNTKLTARNDKERRVGYDFTFNASKSVSLAYTFADEQIKQELLQTFRESVSDTMKEVETGMQARVRRKGKNENRETGNLIYGEFVHFTTRPVEGFTDPHLHSHCFVLNGTYDEKDKKWKAGQFGQIKEDAPYYEAYFHSQFAYKLSKLGFEVERTNNGFELKGISKETIEKFSRRTKEIEEHAKTHNITDKSKKAEIGARTRESKRVNISSEKELLEWKNRLTHEEWNIIKNLKSDTGNNDNDINIIAKEAVSYALNHHLERKSVASDKEILALAIRSSAGETTPDEIKNQLFIKDGVLGVKEGLRKLLTTKAVLAEEKQLIFNANSFKGRFAPINENYGVQNDLLNDQQRKAVTHALNTSDGLSIIVGKAGTGKTTLMQEVKTGILASGRQIFAFAPSSEASRGVQRSEGFQNADTVASLLHNERSHQKLKNQVIWIDEAGLLSNKDLNKIFKIAEKQSARIILSGDTKQHSSVERGDALRIVQKYAKVRSITVDKIQRQRGIEYRQAVQFLSEAKIEHGFKKLESIGAITEIEDHSTRIEAVAEDYINSTYNNKKQKNVLVISPTHAEGDLVTEEIRKKLKKKAVISKDDKEFSVYKNLQWTEAEKRQASKYELGATIKFHQNTKGIVAGTRLKVSSINKNRVFAKDEKGKEVVLPLRESNKFNIFEEKKLKIAKGDKIKITENGKSLEGVHLFNGTSYHILGFDKQGNLKLSNGSTLWQKQGNFSYGYVSTSHSSQGKTTDKTIISQSSQSLKASSKEQFYVSVSRGREAVSIYTDNKHDLIKAVSNSSERKSAIELTELLLTHNRASILTKIKTMAKEAYEQIKTLKAQENELQRHNRSKETGKGR